jgi:hypothetical protein
MSEVTLHRWRVRQHCAQRHTLLIAKGVLEDLASRLAVSRELVTRRPVGLMVGLLTWIVSHGRS